MKKRTVLKNCAVYGMLKKQAKKRHISFHTPGHKRRGFDVTELSYSDNLSSPNGCIKKAEEDIARILGAKRSFILTDGSTAGVHAMLYSAKRAGVKRVAVLNPAHKSLYTGASLCDLEIVHASETHLARLDKADALFVTSPDYYGKVADLERLRAYADKNGKLLIVDGAHGGHLHFDKRLYAGAFAHLWVDGVHKSLPAFTQGAVVSACDERLATLLKEGLDIFRTTSPSYPVMASVEYAVKYPQNKKLQTQVLALENQTERVLVGDDWTKVCAYFGKHAFSAQAQLESWGIYPEFCDGTQIMFYLSPATKQREFRLLKKCLSRLFKRYPATVEKSAQRNPAPLFHREYEKKEWVLPLDAVGKKCAVSFGLFPPCTPLVYAGEIIKEQDIKLLANAISTFGLQDGKVAVCVEEKEETP